MLNVRSSLSSAEIEKELLKYRTQVIKRFRDGDNLGTLCRTFRLDISSVLFLLRKSRLKKKKLYTIYELQKEKIDDKDFISEKEKYYIQKFFPHSETTGLNGGYYWYWREKYKKQQEKKERCKHDVRHIRCGKCNKILRDASNIPINSVITTKINEKEKVDI